MNIQKYYLLVVVENPFFPKIRQSDQSGLQIEVYVFLKKSFYEIILIICMSICKPGY